MKKALLAVSIIFMLLTIAGAVYVLVTRGEVSPGYAVIPMLFSIVFSNLYKRTVDKEKNRNSTDS